MPDDLQTTIDDLFRVAYEEGDSDQEYQSTFVEEGTRKAQYIIDDLRYRELKGDLRTADMGYLCIGGADGSEVKQILAETEISRAVMIEISDSAVERARVVAEEFRSMDKSFVVLQGDANARLGTALESLEQWCAEGIISGLVCSAQAVLHELPARSPGYNLARFLGMIFRHPGWTTRAFYSREPCAPVGWPDEIRLRIRGVEASQLVRAAKYIRDRLTMTGQPEILASNWVQLPAVLAVETLHKLIRGNSIRRIGYELGEQLTSFDALAVQKHLESLIPGMHVTVDQITTSGFKKALEEYGVEFVGQNSECLPIPRTHSEIIGIFASDWRDDGPRSEAELSPEPPTATPARDEVPSTSHSETDLPSPESTTSEVAEGISESHRLASDAQDPHGAPHDVPNPFQGDVTDEQIAQWLAQFEPEEQPVIGKLLARFTYISLSQLRPLVQELHGKVIASLGASSANAWFVPLGGASKSGGFVSYFYRVSNGLSAERFLDYAGLARSRRLENQAIVLLDDLLGTGHQAAQEYAQLRQMVDLPPTCRVILATLVDCAIGTRYITERTDVETCSVIHLARADDPLDPASDLFETAEERAYVRGILRKYGARLAPGHPFGYAGSAFLLAFAHSTPDNTLPIFWSNETGWLPLLHRGGSSRTSMAPMAQPEA